MLGGCYFIFISPSVRRSSVKMSVNQLIKGLRLKHNFAYAHCPAFLYQKVKMYILVHMPDIMHSIAYSKIIEPRDIKL